MSFGSGDYRYEYADGWGKLPDGLSWGFTVAVACDAKDRVYVNARGDYPLMIFDGHGNFIESWGEDVIKDAHGIWIDGEGNVYCTERNTHCMCKFNSQGEYVMRIEIPGTPSEEGPTDLAISSTGDLFISDGYEHRVVRKYTAAGEQIMEWGEEGEGPGQFKLVHSVRIDEQDKVWICDRANRRIQIFDTEGEYISEWNDLLQPNTIYFDPSDDILYMAEIEGQVRVCTRDQETLAQWGGGEQSDAPGLFKGGPHGIWADSHGDIYVGQVGVQGPPQKYVRL